MKKLLLGALLMIMSTLVNAQSITINNNASCKYGVSVYGHEPGHPFESIQTHWVGLLAHTSLTIPGMGWFTTHVGWFTAPSSTGFGRWDCARVVTAYTIVTVGANPIHPTVYSTITGCTSTGNVLWQYDTAGNITVTIND